MVDRIRTEMAMVEINQSRLAQLSGVPETTLSKILNSQSVLDVEQAGAIAGAFGLELWELIVPGHAISRSQRRKRERATQRTTAQ
ncbi:helix-turn-helix domain-containing protein [Skermania sp. ID1734]|uniref:helix-turn-helix domain-containing protein n=1 Tax=Skermania sp. ID1734 TaxID=2597516 RepID=UPI00163D70F8|nr:helix-turn-helix transcriptional regulator [Skermania sp. ID1734]